MCRLTQAVSGASLTLRDDGRAHCNPTRGGRRGWRFLRRKISLLMRQNPPVVYKRTCLHDMSWFGRGAAPPQNAQLENAKIEMEMMTDLFNKRQRGVFMIEDSSCFIVAV